MKTAKYILCLGLTFVLSGVFLNSCTDANDWGTDASSDRLFGTKQSSFTVTEGAVSAEVEWDATVDTEYYIIEASTDSLYDEIPMGAENSIVYGEDGSITKSPYTITGLLGETTYYLRIKSMSKDKQSNWVYLPDYKFTTDKEQIISDVSDTDITDESVVLSWEAGLEVTHITYTQDGELITYTLTDEEKAAGKVTFSGLLSSTEYTFYIYNGEILRGEQTVKTKDLVMVDLTVTVDKTTATVTWEGNLTDATGYIYVKGDIEDFSSYELIQLTEEQKNSKTIVLSQLEPMSIYTIAIMRNNAIRARQTFQTEVGIPTDYKQVTLTNRDDWAGILNDNSGKLAVIIPINTTIDLSSNTSFQTEIPANITSLIIWGEESEDETSKATFKTRGLSLNGDKSDIKFYNLNIESNGTSNYIFRQKHSGTVESISFESCNIGNAAGVFCSRDGESNGTLKYVEFKDCVIFNIGNYSVVRADNPYVINKVYMENSTVNGCTGNIFRFAQSVKHDIEINYTTFYNSNQALIRSDNYNAENVFIISNTIISVVNVTTPNSNNSVQGTNVFTTSDCYGVNWATKLTYDATGLFNDVSKGNFGITVPEYTIYGDPRWNN